MTHEKIESRRSMGQTTRSPRVRGFEILSLLIVVSTFFVVACAPQQIPNTARKQRDAPTNFDKTSDRNSPGRDETPAARQDPKVGHGQVETATPKFVRLADMYSPPSGYTVAESAPRSFADYLSRLRVRTDRKVVESYKGVPLDSPSAGVVDLDVGDRDLQQCADSIIRLHGEWLWSHDRADDVAYHFTSGDKSTWKAWKKGERFKVAGSKVERVNNGKVDNSHTNFKTYLFHTFRYAGTRSLRFDSHPVAVADVQAGDFFVTPGSPGHAVLVLRVAKNDAGKTLLLLGQGFMPAQEFHIIKSSSAVDSVWFQPPSAIRDMRTPSWAPFPASSLRRFSG